MGKVIFGPERATFSSRMSYEDFLAVTGAENQQPP